MIQQPCQLGLKCPYMHLSDEWDMMCTYPYLCPDENETYGFPDEVDCGLMDLDSELADLLIAYGDESGKVKDLVEKECERIRIQTEELMKDFREHRNEMKKRLEE